MRRRGLVSTWLLVASLVGATATAQDLYIYPEKGQSEAQQTQDRGECHTWAVQQTGFDPGMTGASARAEQQSEAGGAVKGAAVGAAGGAIIGAIAGDAGMGAAIGAVTGGLFNGARRRDQNRQAQAQANAQNQQTDRARAEYRRALGACLEGKGYTVK